MKPAEVGTTVYHPDWGVRVVVEPDFENLPIPADAGEAEYGPGAWTLDPDTHQAARATEFLLGQVELPMVCFRYFAWHELMRVGYG